MSTVSMWWRSLCSLLVLAIPAAVAQTPRSIFAVATVRLAPGADPSTGSWSTPGVGSFTATHVSRALLLQLAYGVDNSQIANKPGWIETTLYDVRAKPEDGVALTRDELKPRLQDLLQRRFHLVAHTEMRASRGYALVVSKGGPHLTQTRSEHFPGYRMNVGPGQMRGANWSMPIFAKYLTSVAGFPIVDQTGLAGSFDVAFSFAPDAEVDGADSALPSLATALRRATGLVLKPQTVAVETVVIDSVDRVTGDN